MMFLDVKEFAFILYEESTDPEQSRRVRGESLSSRFFLKLEEFKQKIMEPESEPLLKNFASDSWSKRDLFKNCGAGAGGTWIKNLKTGAEATKASFFRIPEHI